MTWAVVPLTFFEARFTCSLTSCCNLSGASPDDGRFPGEDVADARQQLVWVDRTGGVEAIDTIPPKGYRTPRLSGASAIKCYSGSQKLVPDRGGPASTENRFHATPSYRGRVRRSHLEPAVDRNDGPGDVPGALIQEEPYTPCDLLGLSEAAERDATDDSVDHVLRQ